MLEPFEDAICEICLISAEDIITVSTGEGDGNDLDLEQGLSL